MRQDMQVLTSSLTNEYYTPPDYARLVHAVLGSIDLDPASNRAANRYVRAAAYYTKRQDGLRKPWHGRVFLNPPYGKTAGRSNQEVWSMHMYRAYRRGDFDSGILLIYSTQGYEWYERLWRLAPVCCARKRICFINAQGEQMSEAKKGSTFVYFGRRVALFEKVFSNIGRVILPETERRHASEKRAGKHSTGLQPGT